MSRTGLSGSAGAAATVAGGTELGATVAGMAGRGTGENGADAPVCDDTVTGGSISNVTVGTSATAV